MIICRHAKCNRDMSIETINVSITSTMQTDFTLPIMEEESNSSRLDCHFFYYTPKVCFLNYNNSADTKYNFYFKPSKIPCAIVYDEVIRKRDVACKINS